jgi:acetate kinase
LSEAIVVLNAGSSSIKFAAFEVDARRFEPAQRLLHGEIDGDGPAARLVAHDEDGRELKANGLAADAETVSAHEHALALLFEWLEGQLPGHRVVVVGHRVVHGGARFIAPVRIDDATLRELDALVPLAPLHQPHNLAAIRAVSRLHPHLPQVASFDTAFHSTLPWLAQACALPARVRAAGVRRYGFHGLSYEYIASVLPQFLGDAAGGRIVVAHLGSGASLCAMRDLRSVETTMGFSTLDGLVMGTRCGALDPGIVLHLQSALGMSVAQVEHLLYHESGLLGVSGLSADMRTLLASDDPQAESAIALFVHRISQELGALAASLGGLDALVFTAGIGEHGAAVRARICAAAAWLGVRIDADANLRDDDRIDAPDSRVSVHVIATNEELMLARHACDVVGGGVSHGPPA